MSLEKKIYTLKESYSAMEYKTQETIVKSKLGYTIGVILSVEGALIALGLLANKGCQYLTYVNN